MHAVAIKVLQTIIIFLPQVHSLSCTANSRLKMGRVVACITEAVADKALLLIPL